MSFPKFQKVGNWPFEQMIPDGWKDLGIDMMADHRKCGEIFTFAHKGIENCKEFSYCPVCMSKINQSS